MVDGVQSSDTGSQCSSCSSASSGVVNLEVGFFERERCRLIQEISKVGYACFDVDCFSLVCTDAVFCVDGW